MGIAQYSCLNCGIVFDLTVTRKCPNCGKNSKYKNSQVGVNI